MKSSERGLEVNEELRERTGGQRRMQRGNWRLMKSLQRVCRLMQSAEKGLGVNEELREGTGG